jgi:hypothetical protein
VHERPTNLDLLSWFSEDERDVCSACGEKASVGLPGALARFCFACGAVWVDDRRLDADGKIQIG